jgi:hypothetical protein
VHKQYSSGMSLNWTEINKEITVFKKCIFLVSASVKLCITKLSGTGSNGAYPSKLWPWHPRDRILNCSNDWAGIKGTATLRGDRSGAQSEPLKKWCPTRWAVILCMNVSVKPPNTIQSPNQSIPVSPKLGTAVPVKVLHRPSIIIFWFF